MKKVCIIGGSNIDICAKPYSVLLARDSNPCDITYRVGGVGCNVARNMAKLGANCTFITVFGNDNFATPLKNACNGIDISQSQTVDFPTSVYLCVNDEKGDMYVGANDMRILSALSLPFLQQKLDLINSCCACVFDTNLDAEVLNFLISQVKAPLFLETVSANKCKKLVGKLPFAIKPNVIEAEELSGIVITDDNSVINAARILHKKGAKMVIITLGEKGSYYSFGGKSGFVPAIASKIINTTGAGDAFFAGLICAYVEGKDIEYCVKQGTACAHLTLIDEEAVNPQLTPTKVKNLIEQIGKV